MRIAFITPEFVTNEYFSGGLANYVHRVTRALAEMGHEVHAERSAVTVVKFQEYDFHL